MTRTGRRIVRIDTIEGRATPGFIHNGSYFFVNLQVYADGLVNCWELVDLAGFRDDKLATGWVTTSIPDGKAISVHGLGTWTIGDGRWLLDAGGLFARVTELVKQLNPRMENLYDAHRSAEGQVPRAHLGSPAERPIRRSAGSGSAVAGDHLSILVRDGDWYLADLRAFADGTLELGRVPTPESLDLAGLERGVATGRVASTVAPGTRIHIHQLGSFVAVEEQWSANLADLVREVPDLIEKASGRTDSIQRCRAAYHAYVANPTEATRAALRVAYEAVPEHNRMYVGDMDTKDIPVRMILYGDQEIEHWSHRAVARAHDMPLPTITVPKPKPE